MDRPCVTDCPECLGRKTVILGVCSVCFAEFDEWHIDPAWAAEPVGDPVGGDR